MISTKEKDILKSYVDDISIESMPEFPLHCLPKLFQDFAKVKASNSAINVSAPATAILFMASFLAHGLYYTLRYEEGQELYSDSVNTLWFALFFESGKGKSESTEKWLRYLFSEYRKALANSFSDPDTKNEMEKYGMYTSDTTLESLLQKVGFEGNYAVYTEEIETLFRQLVDSKGIDKSSPLLSIWSGATVKRTRVNASSQTKENSKPNMPILAYGQPFSVSKLFDGNRMASGFFQRWLPVYDDSPVTYVSLSERLKAKSKANRKDSEKKALAGFIECYKKGLENTFYENGVLNPCKDGLYTEKEGFLFTEAVHRSYSMKQIHFKSITTDYSAIYSKAVEQFLRIASCLWLLDSIAEGSYWDKDPILSLDILGRAYELNEYFIKNHILVQKRNQKEIGNHKDIITIDTIVMKLVETGSYSKNAIAQVTGLSYRAVTKIIENSQTETNL